MVICIKNSPKLKVLTPRLFRMKSVLQSCLILSLQSNLSQKLKKVDSNCPHCGKDLAEAANSQYEKDKADCEKEVQDYTEVACREEPRLELAQKGLDELEKSIPEMERKLNNFALRKKEVG